MPDMEFLPEWYRTFYRRKRWVRMQAWLTLAATLVLCAHLGLGARKVRAEESALAAQQGQVDLVKEQLQQLDQLQTLEQRLAQQANIVTKLGPHIPTARLLNALDELMPPEMGLLDLSMDTQLRQNVPTGLAAAGGNNPTLDRQLSVRLHGVAPTGIEVGNFLARLASVPYFSNIAPSYSKDRTSADGHVMREFEVTFTINLNESH